MPARLIKRGSIWYAWVPAAGGGVRCVTTNCTDKKAAEFRAGELEREAVDPAHAAANRTATADACAEFLGSRQRRGRAEGTLHHYRVKLGHVVRLMPRRLGEVNAAACERFIEQRLAEGAAQTTVKKEIRALGATLRHARRQGTYLLNVEAVIPELEETYKPRERFITPLELVALCNLLRPERAAHVVFIVATGARWGESVRARREDTDGAMVHLRGTKTARALRTVPVPPTMRGAIAWALANAPADLFRTWGSVRRDLAVACKHLGIAPVTPNDLRRTFATWLRASGVTPDIIGAAMGHTTSRMAELVYGRISPASLDRLITERGPALIMSKPEKESKRPVGYVSSSVAPPCELPVFPETVSEPTAGSVSGENTSETPLKLGARGRNRTADTGIFKPQTSPVNTDESSGFTDPCRANGLTFGACARRWFMRRAA